MATGISFDANYKNASLAIKRLPNFADVTTRIFTKSVAKQFLKLLKSGIKNRQLRLKPLQIRKGGIPLYNTGDLVNSLDFRYYKKTSGGVYHVGAVPNKMHKSGLSIRKIMWVHEYGLTIRVTEKMRRWLAANLEIYLKKDTQFIRIPPRPAIRTSWSKFIRDAKLRGQIDRSLNKITKQYIRTARINAAEQEKIWAI